MQEWNAGIQKGYRLSPLTFSGKVTNSANTEKHRETQDSRNPLQGRNDGRLMPGARRRRGEAVISLLSDFILEFLRHTRSSMTKIVTYLRNAMTQYDMKIRMKSESAKKALLPKYISNRRPCEYRIHWA